MKDTREVRFYDGKIPPKNKFFVALFWLDCRLLQFILKPVIKKIFFKHLQRSDFIPGIRSLYGNIYGENVFLANANYIDYVPIYIGKGTSIGFDCTLITSSHTPGNFSEIVCKSIFIGKNCFIGNGTTILPGVTIGDNVTIGASSVVTKDIPSNSVAVGNPAKVIRKL